MEKDTRLFVTEDKHTENVYYARTKGDMFARFAFYGNYWEVYFYKGKNRQRKHTLTETLKFIDRQFKLFVGDKK